LVSWTPDSRPLRSGWAGAKHAGLTPTHDVGSLDARAIALAAGVSAGSIALIGFGADSLIEALAGSVVLWLLTAKRRGSTTAERRAQQLIAASFFLLAGYVGVEALRTLVKGDHPAASWVGIGLAAVTAPTIPLLAYAKRRLGNQLHSGRALLSSAPQQP
jgi:divalent metal cation (Fe/Co/Zn/Cd) transporter